MFFDINHGQSSVKYILCRYVTIVNIDENRVTEYTIMLVLLSYFRLLYTTKIDVQG